MLHCQGEKRITLIKILELSEKKNPSKVLNIHCPPNLVIGHVGVFYERELDLERFLFGYVCLQEAVFFFQSRNRGHSCQQNDALHDADQSTHLGS